MPRKALRPLCLSQLMLLALGAVLLLAAGSCLRERPRPVKIGLLAPYSGREVSAGYGVLFAVKLAIAERNREGGISGRPIELVAHDSAPLSAGQSGVQRGIERFLADPDVVVVLGYLDPGEALEAAQALQDSSRRSGEGPPGAGDELVLINIGLTPRSPSADSRLVSPLPDEEAVAAAIVRLVAQEISAPTLALVYSWRQPRHGFGLAGAVDEAASLAGIEVTAFVEVDDAVDDPQRVAGADVVVVLGSHLQAAKVAVALREAGFEGPLVLSPAASVPEYITLAQEAAVGSYLTALAPYPADAEGARDFVRSYRQRWNAEPGFAAGAAYDVTHALLSVIERAAKEGQLSRQRVAEAVSSAPAYEGTLLALPPGFASSGGRGVYFYRLGGLSFPGVPAP